jgi:hypothetical protein
MQSRETGGLGNLTLGMKIPAAENSRRPPLWARTACRPIARWKAGGVVLSGKDHREHVRSTGPRASSESSSRPGPVRRAQESGHVFRGKLEAQGRAKMIDAKVAEVFIEIP